MYRARVLQRAAVDGLELVPSSRRAAGRVHDLRVARERVDLAAVRHLDCENVIPARLGRVERVAAPAVEARSVVASVGIGGLER
eukprot:2072424-Prymnesium_polylepis.1